MQAKSHEGKVWWCERHGMDPTSAGGGISWLGCEFVLGRGRYRYKPRLGRLRVLKVMQHGLC